MCASYLLFPRPNITLAIPLCRASHVDLVVDMVVIEPRRGRGCKEQDQQAELPVGMHCLQWELQAGIYVGFLFISASDKHESKRGKL